MVIIILIKYYSDRFPYKMSLKINKLKKKLKLLTFVKIEKIQTLILKLALIKLKITL